MKSRINPALLALFFAVIFFSSMFGYIFGFNASKNNIRTIPESTLQPHTVYSAENEVEKISADTPKKEVLPYVLRANDGLVALYSRSEDMGEKLWQTYDIAVSLLPESDRKQLEKGIEFSSISDALSAIEDFSS